MSLHAEYTTKPGALIFQKTISRCRPVIIFEHLYLPDADVTSLTPHGYSIRSIDNASGELTTAFDRSVGHNSVLLPVSDH